jgi:hypothetical protein
VTEFSPESPGNPDASIIDMPESLVKFPGGCGASWLQYHYLLSRMVELRNHHVALLRNG